MPCHSRSRTSVALNVAGALDRWEASYTLIRITACGHTMAHLPHWMQVFASHTGISSAMLRFSHLLVPVGYVPSGGKALTGISSPWPAYMVPSTSRSYLFASGENGGGISISLVAFPGSLTSNRQARVSS